jgi:hypothetical protein
MPHEADVTSLNPSFPLLCGHVKKKKKVTLFFERKYNVKEK